MTNEFDMSTIKIPYGVLHDAKLKGVSEADNRMIFSFDFDLSPEDYEPEFYERYAGFKHCDMIVEMTDEPWNYFFLQTCLNGRGRFLGQSLGREEFVNAINNATEASFLECTAGYREFRIELAVNFFRAKEGYHKYRKYVLCYITLDAKRIEWAWA